MARGSRMRLIRLVLMPAVLWLSAGGAEAQSRLPVYVEDSHAGSFYWLIQNLDLNAEYQLLLFDRHSDSSQLFDSDTYRNAVKKGVSTGSLDSLIGRWRGAGSIQCFNWIEPLMPKPVSRVVWILPDNASVNIKEMRAEIPREINCHQAVTPRRCEDLAPRFNLAFFRDQTRIRRYPLPVVASIDLDYFTLFPAKEIESRLTEVWDYLLSLDDLRAVTVSLSSPYMDSPEQRDSLLSSVFRILSETVNTKVFFEPFLRCGPDRSRKAALFYRSLRDVPEFQIEKTSPSLKSRILQSTSLFEVKYGTARFDSILRVWPKELEINPRIVLRLAGEKQEVSAFHSIPETLEFDVSLETGPSLPDGAVLSWTAIVSREMRFNITRKNGSYGSNAPPFVRFREIPIPSGPDPAVLESSDLLPYFDPATRFGTVRVFARIQHGGETYLSNILCLSRYRDETYPGRLTEIFNLPYIFGSGLIQTGCVTGADARFGADCTNFIIYGKRRAGADIPYLNPGQLEKYMIGIDSVSGFRRGFAMSGNTPIPITDEMISDGLLLHFGGHLAAVYEDRPPEHFLDLNDRVAHQMEDAPRILALKELKQIRYPFRVMRFRNGKDL
jgi:hypothetical protein